MKLLKRRARFDPQLVHKSRSGTAKGFERLRLASGPVEREHLEPAQALPQRVLGDERVDLSQHGGVVAAGEARLQSAIDHEQAQLLKTGGRPLQEGLADQVSKCRPAPFGESLPK